MQITLKSGEEKMAIYASILMELEMHLREEVCSITITVAILSKWFKKPFS